LVDDMSVSDKVTLSGPGAYIARLERDLASMRASRDALVGALNRLCACVADVNEDRLCEMANDKSEPKLAEEAAAVLQARAALAQYAKKGEAS
jgi:hypothetical protein